MQESPTGADPVVRGRCAVALGVFAAIFAAVAIASPAGAYQTVPNSGGNPNYSSVIRAIVPSPPGVTARVLGHDNLVRLENRGDRTVVVYGYSGDQYARLLPDGTVQLNLRSPAFYLSEYRFGDQTVPPYADAHAAPDWRTMDHSHLLAWHDHRIHAASGATPPAGTRRNTLLFAYRIPLRVGGRPAAISGKLYWIGGHGNGAATWELFALPPTLVILLLLVLDAARRLRRPRASAQTAR